MYIYHMPCLFDASQFRTGPEDLEIFKLDSLAPKTFIIELLTGKCACVHASKRASLAWFVCLNLVCLLEFGLFEFGLVEFGLVEFG